MKPAQGLMHKIFPLFPRGTKCTGSVLYFGSFYKKSVFLSKKYLLFREKNTDNWNFSADKNTLLGLLGLNPFVEKYRGIDYYFSLH
jgi:hypothetical protein